MSALRLTLRERPSQRVDLSPLTANRLAGKTVEEVAALELRCGNIRIRLDSLFALAGTPGTELEIHGSTDRLDRIGAGLAEGRISIAGDVGTGLGMGMTGGRIEVAGHAGMFVGTGMRDGLIRVGGNAGDFLAAAIPGNHQGMLGGTILVRGNAGDRAGDRMRRGMVLIEGGAGDYCASRMVAGTIAVLGPVGRAAGLAMRRGTLLLARTPGAGTLLPTFGDCGQHTFPMLTLLTRSWRGLGGPFAAASRSPMLVERFMGDLANDGRGEILLWL